MLLFIGSLADETLLHVVGRARETGVSYSVLDVAHAALVGGWSIRPYHPNESHIDVADARYELALFRGYYCRLQNAEAGAPDDPSATRYRALHRGLSSALDDPSLRVVNPPGRDRSNFSKPFHARWVSQITGWSVPSTILSNDRDALVAFVDAWKGAVIVKGTSAAKTWVRKYDAADFELLGRTGVVMLQQYIPGFEVRVHWVAGVAVAERIDASGVDYRRACDNRYRPCEVPTDIARGLTALEKESGLPMLGVDFRVDADGRWLFLEANPMPAFHGYDRRCGGRISAALLEYLDAERG